MKKKTQKKLKWEILNHNKKENSKRSHALNPKTRRTCLKIETQKSDAAECNKQKTQFLSVKNYQIALRELEKSSWNVLRFED